MPISNKYNTKSNTKRKPNKHKHKSRTHHKLKIKTHKIRNKKHNKYINHLHHKYIGGNLIDESFLLSYEKNLNNINYIISNYSGKHTINHTDANLFINTQLTDIRKQAARDLIENTIYITLQEISSIIENLIIKLYKDFDLNSAEKIYFYSGKPDKSFYFMAILALFYIKQHHFKEPLFVNELNNELFDTIDNNHLIMLDDISYSGNQLSTMLNNIYYERVIKNKQNPPNLHILLIALNNFSLKKLTKVPIKKTKSGIYIEYTTSPFKLLFLPDRLYTPLIIKLGLERYLNLNIFFSPYTGSNPYVSIYLDYTIADEASTYKTALLYGPIIPSNYDYKYFLTDYIDYQFDIMPSKDLFEPTELLHLINTYNQSNNDTVTIINNSVISKLINKLIKTEELVSSLNISLIQFKPFINTCNKSKMLLDNISNHDIVNLNYSLFMAPKGCISNNNDCVINDEAIISYLNEFANKQDFNKTLEICNLIHTINCPFKWYKSGELQMSSIKNYV
jgi:hypothetical protein